jgi:serine protease inhibitor ecotin
MKTIEITEHDEYFECERVFIIDEQDWNFSEKGDADAALRVAETIEAQAPESLEIICKYMTYADKLGSKIAHDWLYDYYVNTDEAAEPWS